MSNFFAPKAIERFSRKNPESIRITDSVIKDLIIGEGLPVQLVESHGFLNFLQVVQPKYEFPTRKTVWKIIEEMVKQLEEKFRERLSAVPCVSITLDLWSDRRMRSFIGITAHVIKELQEKLEMATLTLCCEQFIGTYSGENVAACFEKTMVKYQIKN